MPLLNHSLSPYPRSFCLKNKQKHDDLRLFELFPTFVQNNNSNFAVVLYLFKQQHLLYRCCCLKSVQICSKSAYLTPFVQKSYDF